MSKDQKFYARGQLKDYFRLYFSTGLGDPYEETDGNFDLEKCWSAAEDASGKEISFPAVKDLSVFEDTKQAFDFFTSDKKILIVEDEEVSLQFMKGILKEFEPKLLIARNGHEALDIMTHSGQDIKLILLDLSMPVMDGLEFMKHLETLVPVEKRDFVIEIVSGIDDWEMCKSVIELGATSKLSKPISPKSFFEVVTEDLLRSQ